VLEDCENGIGPVDHVEVVGWVPVEPLVALKTRPGCFHGREGAGEGGATEKAFKGILLKAALPHWLLRLEAVLPQI